MIDATFWILKWAPRGPFCRAGWGFYVATWLVCGLAASACKSESSEVGPSSGGSHAGASGGASSGGSNAEASGGFASGGAASGGAASGGAATGGNGTGTGGTTDATGGTDGSGCEGVLFCDDFEEYGDTGAPGGAWSVSTSDAQVTMDTERAYSGSRSVKVSAAGGGGRVAFLVLDGAPVFPVAENHYFGRMRFWLESVPTSSVNWTFIEAEGLVPGESYRAQYRYGGQHAVDGGNQLMANYETPDSYGGTGPSSDCWRHADSVVVPVGEWACAEWEFDGPNHAMRFWLNGEAVESLTVTGAGEGCVHQAAEFQWTAPHFERLHLGWQAYQEDSERTLWIDDVAIHGQRIGCGE